MANKEKKLLRWNFSISLLIHLTIIAALASVTIRIYEKHNAGANSASSGGGQSAAHPAAPAPKIDPQTVSRALEKEDARVAAISDEEKMAELRKKSVALADMDSHAVDAVASTVESVKGADKSRAYSPQENVTGKFDSATATLYDISREKRDDQPVFVYTLVDAQGRSMKAVRKMEEMSADDMRAYQLFEMGRNNQNMARLLKSAIMIGQQHTNAPAKKTAAATSRPAN